uniref:Uncharacterized protein n=1 Tax=candidate division WOR-3 bacterium TaxID=2052148 RepID=A0A7C6A842_UNCW3
MRRLIILLTIVAFIMPNLTEAGKYRARYWTHLSFIDCSIALPPYYSIGYCRGAIGFPPPYGLGVGTVLLDGFGRFESGEEIAGRLPLNIYYVPFSKWDKDGKAKPIFYSYLSINYWLAESYTSESNGKRGNYLKLGTGITWLFAGLRQAIIHLEVRIFLNLLSFSESNLILAPGMVIM